MAAFLQKRYAMPLLLGGGAILTALTLVFPQVGFLEWATMVPMIAGAFLLCGREGVRLRNCIVMQNTVVNKDARMSYVIADKDVVITEGTNLAGCPDLPLIIPKGTKL